MKLPSNLFKQRPCADAITWLNTQRDAATAWQNCQRGDWMWWTLRFLPGALPEKEVSVAFAQWCAQRAAWAAAWVADWAAKAADCAAGGTKAELVAQADWIRAHIPCAQRGAKAAAKDAAWVAWAADWAAKAATWTSKATKTEFVAQADWIRAHIPCPFKEP